MSPRSLTALVLAVVLAPLWSQGTSEDYARAESLPEEFRGKVTQMKLEPLWVDGGAVVWFRRDEGGGRGRWVAVTSATGEAEEAFDHDRLASALGEATSRSLDASRLPLQSLRVVNGGGTIDFEALGRRWSYVLPGDERPEGELREREAPADERRRPRGRRRVSPDGRTTARIVEHDVEVRSSAGETVRLTEDGVEGDGYLSRFSWSPDSKYLVAMRRRSGDTRKVTIIDSAPDDRLQPRTSEYGYLKPGDQVPILRPRLFDVGAGTEVELSDELAPNPYDIRGVRWKRDGSVFTYEYNQRGHQVYRVIEVDPQTGSSRAVISEEPETFFTYSSKRYLHYLDDTDELLWMSERDGWNHLYLIDWQTGDVKRQVTSGEWVVRKVERVDAEARAVWFWAGGVHPEQDPYHLHYCRADLDGGGVTVLTEGDGTHTDLSVSPDEQFLVTTWSRIDHAPVHELRDARTGKRICELARADASRLVDAGWRAPERFVAPGRDGKTEIYGIIVRPTTFDPELRYPVIESIYAGPHGQHVPKAFRPFLGAQQLAEIGFVVVRIDGMGTNWRSKAFHDVCWKNLKDAGFPDRIAWMKAAAETRPWMDLSRVGIHGGSAGGQNAMRAVLDHADFYKAAAADCGCHDNRMDKIWWNEQWMGWPVDESYAASSNVVDAHKLGGALLLTVGELDRNVDPASTMQVVDELIRHDKEFELMVFPGRGHGAGGSPYGRRLMADFFVRHLHGVVPRRE